MLNHLTGHQQMAHRTSWGRFLLLLLATTAILATGTAFAQNFQDLLSGPDDLLGEQKGTAQTTVTATLVPAAGVSAETVGAGDEVVLSIRLDVPADAYTYSQNRSFGGATQITVTELYGLEPMGDAFVPDHKPKVKFEEDFSQEIEKFADEVTWSRRFRLTGAAPADQVSIAGEIKFQVCDASSCTPLAETFEVFMETAETASTAVQPAGDSGPAAEAVGLAHGYVVRPTRPKPDPLTLQFELSPVDAQPGETVTLAITMALEDDWHTFGLTPHEKQISNPTEIALLETDNLRPLDEAFRPVHPPEAVTQEGLDDVIENMHHGTVTWTRSFEVAEPGDYGVTGEIAYQICKTSCMPLKAVSFSLGSLQRPADIATASPMSASFIPTGQLAQTETNAVDDVLDFELQSDTEQSSLAWYLLMAFLGGLILNIMPCVLPVLAIKIMSFVQQAGEHRGRVLLLNVCYSLGVIGVFLVLATLAVTLKMGWGGLFQKPEFNLAMIAIVFAMGLSMLGVFEIPIPGMVGSAGSEHREGLPGAFMTGIFATLLATPCSGPLMGSALAWSVKQSPPIVFLVWGVMGLGMASPYLMVGLFPDAIRFLPKPGMWMVRFKEFSGFALLAAAIWLMNSMEQELLLPTLVLLLTLGLALWMVGTLYDHSSPASRKMTVRALALLVMIVAGGFGWSQYQDGTELADARRAASNDMIAGHTTDSSENGGLAATGGEDHELPWQKFSGERLTELLREGKPVMVDFTADWCLICKTNERVALNTPATSRFVDEHDIVPLYADFTRDDAEIKEWLGKFNSISVPLMVIFPAGDPQHPIILDGPYSESMLLSHLEKAVTSDVAARDSLESSL